VPVGCTAVTPRLLDQGAIGLHGFRVDARAWELFYDGDSINLPRILRAVRGIDLFHYDSDKSFRTKEEVLAMVRPKISPQGFIVVDDTDRDAFFRKVVARWGRETLVFRNVGVIGLASACYA